MPQFKEFYFDSCVPNKRIRAKSCTPDGSPKAVVQIAHGIAEHIDRYEDFMRFLAENGYVAAANDHLGHGKSAENPGELGFFAEEDGWNRVLDDMDELRHIMRGQYPDLPYIFFGHSMGSFLTRTYIINNPGKYDAAILSGTGHQGKPLVIAGYTMAKLAVKFSGPRSIGYMLNDVAFGAYNKGFENPRTKYDWLSRDPEIVDKYIADPNCGYVATVSLFRDMMGGIKYITDQNNIDKMNKEAPIYFMSGAADPVGENGAGVERAYQAFLKAGLKDVMMRLYPEGRHEMLNEINKEAVFQDILNWLEEKLPLIK